jgi:hypothetical protein
MKRFLPIIGILVAVLLVVFLLWFFFLRGTTEQQGQTLEGPNFGTFFETTNGGNFDFRGNLENLPPEEFVQETRVPILRQLSAEPIAGYSILRKEFEVEKEGTTTEETIEPEEKNVFRFMERGTGHILETVEDSLEIEKVTNTTIQKVNSVVFSEDGNKVLFQKLNEQGEGIDSFLGEIVDKDDGLEEKVLETQAYSILSQFFTLSPDLDEFAFLIQSGETGQILKDDFEGSGEDLLYSSSIKDWLLSWDSPNYITLSTRPSSNKIGNSYLLTVSNGSFRKILSRLPGLMSKVSPDAEKVLYSQSNGNLITLNVKDLGSNEEKQIALTTFPEKCVFSVSNNENVYCGAPKSYGIGEYPDDWYKGKVSFNDAIWMANIETGLVRVIYNFDEETYGQFDVVDLKLSQEDKYLTFQNKKDLTLWSLDLDALDNRDNFMTDSVEDF